MTASAPRVMCLSNMWPGADDPDYGSFVADMCDALRARGLPVETVVIDRRAGGPVRTPAKYGGLAARAARAARRADVIYAHYLFPTGAVAMAAAAGAKGIPYVLTAHGRDVRNLEQPALRRATAPALSRAAGLIAVSHHLAEALRASGLPLPPVHVIDMGVDMERFVPGDRGQARARLGLPAAGPLVLAVGGLTERKNPLGLLQAFARVRTRRPGGAAGAGGRRPAGRRGRRRGATPEARGGGEPPRRRGPSRGRGLGRRVRPAGDRQPGGAARRRGARGPGRRPAGGGDPGRREPGRWCRIPRPAGWSIRSTRRRSRRPCSPCSTSRLRPRPAGDAAGAHALTRQAGRVAEVLEDAVAAGREGAAE